MKHILLALPVQSISDIITNSSSEVFILQTDKTCEVVNSMLKGITSGFRYPEVFSLKDFREWKEKLRNGEVKDDWSYPGTVYSIANGWFYDSGDEESVLGFRRGFLFDPYLAAWNSGVECCTHDPAYKEPIHDAFIELVNSKWSEYGEDINKELSEAESNYVYTDKLDWRTFCRNRWYLESILRELADSLIKSWDGPKPTVWDIPKSKDVVNLDGRILVVGEYDNSIPFDTWDEIRNMFDCYNLHLG